MLMIPVFFVLDMFWLGIVAKGFYQSRLGGLLSENVNWPAAVIFYLMFLAGLLFFVVMPAAARDSLVHGFLRGLFFGLITYATYDLTNLATLKNWSLSLSLVDILWGMVLSAAVGTAGVGFARWLGA
jgi:uncharacterized membrane protein